MSETDQKKVAFATFKHVLDTNVFITLQEAVLQSHLPFQFIQRLLHEFYVQEKNLFCTVSSLQTQSENETIRIQPSLIQCSTREEADKLLQNGGIIYSLQKVILNDITVLSSLEMSKEMDFSNGWPSVIKCSTITKSLNGVPKVVVCESTKENHPLPSAVKSSDDRPQTLQSNSLTAKAVISSKPVSSGVSDFFKVRPTSKTAVSEKSQGPTATSTAVAEPPLPKLLNSVANDFFKARTVTSKAVVSNEGDIKVDVCEDEVEITKECPCKPQAKAEKEKSVATDSGHKRKSTATTSEVSAKRRCFLIDDDDDFHDKPLENKESKTQNQKSLINEKTDRSKRLAALIDDEEEDDFMPKKVEPKPSRKTKGRVLAEDSFVEEKEEEQPTKSPVKVEKKPKKIVEPEIPRPHKVKKWVTKTFVDSEGYLVTERVMEEVMEEPSAAEVSEFESVSQEKSLASTGGNGGSQPSSSGAVAVTKPQPPKGKGKQTSLMCFFKKG